MPFHGSHPRAVRPTAAWGFNAPDPGRDRPSQQAAGPGGVRAGLGMGNVYPAAAPVTAFPKGQDTHSEGGPRLGQGTHLGYPRTQAGAAVLGLPALVKGINYNPVG